MLPLDLPEDRVERMLQRPVDRRPLRRAQFFEVGVYPFSSLVAAFAEPAAEVLDDFLTRQDGLGDVIQHECLGL